MLVARFLIDFLNLGADQPLLNPLYSFSDNLLGPFEDTFEKSVADGSVLDFSTIVAILAFVLSWYICSTLVKIIFHTKLARKGKKLVNLLFTGIEALFFFRLLLEILKAKSNRFTSFVSSITNVLVVPFEKNLPSNDLSTVIAAGVSILLIGIVWFVASKLLSGVTSSIEAFEEQEKKRKAREEGGVHAYPRESLEAVSTLYKQESEELKVEEEKEETSLAMKKATGVISKIEGVTKEVLGEGKKESTVQFKEEKKTKREDVPESPLG